MDDVINVSGHRIGTAEVESALVLNNDCAEAAVVGYEHPIKGQGIYAFVTLNANVEFTETIRKDLIKCEQLYPHFTPCLFHQEKKPQHPIIKALE